MSRVQFGPELERSKSEEEDGRWEKEEDETSNVQLPASSFQNGTGKEGHHGFHRFHGCSLSVSSVPSVVIDVTPRLSELLAVLTF
jgi:hypothetical protein